MLVRVLGAVELGAGGDAVVSLPGTRQPALLAALAARADKVVKTDRLVLVPLDDRVHLPDAVDLIERAIVDHVRRHA